MCDFRGHVRLSLSLAIACLVLMIILLTINHTMAKQSRPKRMVRLQEFSVFVAADKLETIPSRILDILTKMNGDGDRSTTSIVRFRLRVDPLSILDGFRQRAKSSQL
jgi:hypothetical protein